MPKKLALFFSLAVVSAALVALPATSSAAYVGVFVTPSATGFCTPAPGLLSYKLSFKAKVTATGTTKPKQVRIGYKVADADTGAVLRSGVLNLKKKSRYRGMSKRFTATADQRLYYYVNMRYRAYGKQQKDKRRLNDSIPSAEKLASADIPAC
jgi:hypothetical protein